MASSFSRRTVRARIRLATFEQAMTKTSTDAASSTNRTVLARDVIWSRRRTASIRRPPSRNTLRDVPSPWPRERCAARRGPARQSHRAPMPSASVRTTVAVSPLTRTSERTAYFSSPRKSITAPYPKGPRKNNSTFAYVGDVAPALVPAVSRLFGTPAGRAPKSVPKSRDAAD